jgi:shikimate kinase
MSQPVMIDDRSVTVRVPASTSNLGAGFDTLGLALQIYNEVTIAPAPRGMVEPAFGNSAGSAVTVAGALSAFGERTGVEPPGLFFEAKGDVPWSRGLGSSATLIAGVLAGLNELCGTGLDKMDLVRLCAREEGHPDNAMAAVLGGFCVARRDPDSNALRDVIRVDVRPELKFVVVAPELEFSTGAHRAPRGEQEREQRGVPHGRVHHGRLRQAARRGGRFSARALPPAENPGLLRGDRRRARGGGAHRLAQRQRFERVVRERRIGGVRGRRGDGRGVCPGRREEPDFFRRGGQPRPGGH